MKVVVVINCNLSRHHYFEESQCSAFLLSQSRTGERGSLVRADECQYTPVILLSNVKKIELGMYGLLKVKLES